MESTPVLLTLIGALFTASGAGLGAESTEKNDWKVVSSYFARAQKYCGTESLLVSLTAIGCTEVSLEKLEQEVHVEEDGVSADELVAAAERHGVALTPVRSTLGEIKTWDRPVILHVNDGHYVAFLGSGGDKLLIFDNTIGLVELTEESFHEKYRWSGTGLVVGGVPAFWSIVLRSPLLIISVLLSVGVRELLLRFRPRTGPPTPTQS